MLSGESPGGISGGLGKGGGMSPGMGGGAGMGNSFSGLGGMQSEGGYSGEGGGGIGMMGAGAAIGAEALNAAMADPLLIDVRIGGLLTLYMTPEESETQAKTEEAAAKEAKNQLQQLLYPVHLILQQLLYPAHLILQQLLYPVRPTIQLLLYRAGLFRMLLRSDQRRSAAFQDSRFPLRGPIQSQPVMERLRSPRVRVFLLRQVHLAHHYRRSSVKHSCSLINL